MRSIVSTGALLALASGALAWGADGEVFAELEEKAVVDAFSAEGVQQYECRDGWKFRGPTAILKDPRRGGKPLGIHSSCPICGKPGEVSPTWELFDGTRLGAKKVDKRDRPGAIPELVLEVTQNSGAGVGRTATHIRRVQTEGGREPAANLCTSQNQGQVIAVPYKATYQLVDSTRALERRPPVSGGGKSGAPGAQKAQ